MWKEMVVLSPLLGGVGGGSSHASQIWYTQAPVWRNIMTYSPLHSNTYEYKNRRAKLRRNQTKAESILWQELRNKKLGYKFRRQFQLGLYVVDFYCRELRLVIELDGPIHQHKAEYDKYRENWLKQRGFFVLRYINDEVLFEREAMMRHLLKSIKNREQNIRS